MAETTQTSIYDWGKIWQVFNPPRGLDESKVHINYQISPESLRSTQQIIREMNQAVRARTEQLGLKGINPLTMLDEERGKYAEAIRSDETWARGFGSLLEKFNLDLDPEEAKKRVTRPWWLAINFANDPATDLITVDNKYQVTPSIYPSPISQLIESRMPGINFPGKVRPCSVINALRTSDGKLMYGLRAGANFANVYMPVAVGSVELHLEPGEGDSIFGSNRKELGEELGFSRKHYKDSRLVAMTEETHIAKGGWIYYVFNTDTDLTETQIIEHWKTAVDRGEHQRLEGFDYSDPKAHLVYLAERAFDLSKADPSGMNKVTPDNYNTFLQQAILSTAAYFASQYGFDWAKKTEPALRNHFDLTSCFEI